MKGNLVNYYFKRIEFYWKQRGGKGITQGDMTKAQKDVRNSSKENYDKGISKVTKRKDRT